MAFLLALYLSLRIARRREQANLIMSEEAAREAERLRIYMELHDAILPP